ncbi:GNAT family N-acetyltransferase [Ligilactobacillus apodemi]|uniref:GCN5-related N-acetyltransferase n=1 Tax=Ligilactobacillus apodemi DSM 16634 = JCM 16172 TaxID=1423724 RepID=A0A0R1TZW1_9LACO|nr:GNAT family N-acetyltransferase [Ligilactobacillus apodemi]KRL86735.1 GCN5-related N-acetyltransferase [Ligilactobacillus apodemi DSM 16634 = JCM 16172]MCR1901904.1 GNAT family N-acetyltransferase [Ligilactobacillus apodemi]
MLLQRLDFLLPFEVKLLTVADIDEIYALQAKHHTHHKLYLGRRVTKEDVLEDLTSLPPKAVPDQKFYLGFYQAKQLVAVVDLILDYPSSTCAWLGLIMIKKELVRQGIATKIMHALKGALKREGYQELFTLIPVDQLVAQTFFDTLDFNNGVLTSVYNPALKHEQSAKLRSLVL